MLFDVAADAYDRFMGRYSVLLSPQLADLAGVAAGQRVIDVGCGPGALTAELVDPRRRRFGRRDRSVGAVRRGRPRTPPGRRRPARLRGAAAVPGRHVRCCPRAARRPVHERPGGGRGGDGTRDPAGRRGCRVRVGSRRRSGAAEPAVGRGQGARSRRSRARRCASARVRDSSSGCSRTVGLVDVDETALSVSVEHPTFEEWWEPFTLGVGPAGAYVAGLDAEHQAELREQCRAMLPAAPFVLTARAWTALGRACSRATSRRRSSSPRAGSRAPARSA